MFLFMLTAREGRVSAKRFAPSSSRNPETRAVSSPAANAFVCLALSPADISRDKTGNSAGVLSRH
jgi:hypothetical protein